MNWDGLEANSYWHNSHRILFNKDCRSIVELPDEFIQMVVTSPPYWGLRKYADLPDLIWGGDERCEHEWVSTPAQEAYSGRKRFVHGHDGEQAQKINRQDNPECWEQIKTGDWCSLCGAWKGAYGLEPTPEMYVQHTIEILREIRRVLRKDGVVFWNIGDSYWGGGQGNYGDSQKEKTNRGSRELTAFKTGKHNYLKPKDLCLIPFRVAISAQENGWWVRSVIIWNKPNPMPESVTDRPTESHEYILMLTKSAKYYWDMEAVREPQTEGTFERYGKGNGKIPTRQKMGGSDRVNESFLSATPDAILPNGRNLRSVWTFPTQPYKLAHFATYPEKLVEICVKAATPEVGCCSKCGKPWVRIVEHKNMVIKKTETYAVDSGNRTATAGTMVSPAETKTIGWQPQCKCNADKVPSIVLDPFAGSGTTLKVAAELGRKAIGYELSGQYCKLIIDRNKQQVMGLEV